MPHVMESKVSTHLETPAEDCIVVKLCSSDGNPDSDHLIDEASEDDFPAEKVSGFRVFRFPHANHRTKSS